MTTARQQGISAMECFIENITHIIEARGISQSELARRSGISIPNMNRILRGKEGVTLERAERIADALGKKLQDLLKIPANVA